MLFSPSKEHKPNWSALSISFIGQALGLALLIHFGVIRPEAISTSVHRYVAMELAEAPAAHARAPRQLLKRIPAPRPELDHLFESQVKVAVTAVPSPPLVQHIAPPAEPTRPLVAQSPVIRLSEKPKLGEFPEAGSAALAVKPKAKVQTGAFSSGSSAVASLQNLPSHQVQTGGFGDPNGIKGVSQASARLTAAAVGGFDLPSGPGRGNGVGGSHGTAGTLASAGFGNGVATAHPGSVEGGDHARGAVQRSGFGDGVPAGRAKVMPVVLKAVTPRFTPVEILSKPTPVYSQEARALRLEGEVVLEVMFGASGHAHVDRVIRGLGHGLDQAATLAVANIRFRPARRDGQPTDSTAVIRVLFQLAY